MAIFLTWCRALYEKWWVEPCFAACQTSRFNGNVNYNIKMTTLHDSTTIQINERKYKIEKQTINSQQKEPGNRNFEKKLPLRPNK